MSNIPHDQEPHAGQRPTDDELACLRAQFQSEYPTRDICHEQLYKGTYESGIPACRHCSSANVTKSADGKNIRCNACKRITWLTAGTFFAYVKRPDAWWFAIWLLEQGVIPSKSQFERHADVAYPTAWNILRKLDLVIAGQMPADAVTALPSAFRAAICRRSSETPARAHPLAEIVHLENEQFDRTSASQSDSSSEPAGHSPEPDTEQRESDHNPIIEKNQQQKIHLDLPDEDGKTIRVAIGKEAELLALLSAEPIHFDVLKERTGMSAGELAATLTIMEMSGAAKGLGGDLYIRTASPTTETENVSRLRRDFASVASPAAVLAIVRGIVDFLRDRFHGVSVKYLQLCVATYWCCVDRAKWTVGSLLEACQKVDPITDADVRAYKSPVMIKVP